MGKVVKRGYEDKYCPRCQTKRYFDGNECQVCHITFSAEELEQKQESGSRLREEEFGKKLLARKWKVEAFKLCERCKRFYSFDPTACPYPRPFGVSCPLFIEVKKDDKDTFLRKVAEEVSERPKKSEAKSSVQIQQLKERIKKESKYISWGWKFCPNCYSTNWEPAYDNRVCCKECGKIFS